MEETSILSSILFIMFSLFVSIALFFFKKTKRLRPRKKIWDGNKFVPLGRTNRIESNNQNICNENETVKFWTIHLNHWMIEWITFDWNSKKVWKKKKSNIELDFRNSLIQESRTKKREWDTMMSVSNQTSTGNQSDLGRKKNHSPPLLEQWNLKSKKLSSH